jgi:hypothetical protein
VLISEWESCVISAKEDGDEPNTALASLLLFCSWEQLAEDWQCPVRVITWTTKNGSKGLMEWLELMTLLSLSR